MVQFLRSNKAVSKAILVLAVVVVVAVAAAVGFIALSGRYQAPRYGQLPAATQAATSKTTQPQPYPTTQTPVQTTQRPYVSQTTQPQTQTVTSAPQAQRTISISIKEWAYNGTNPTIQAKVGETIRVTVKNEGTFSHTFTSDELNVNTGLISPGASKTVTITATQAGSFVYYCTVDGHKSLGLKGTLVVSQY